MIHNNGTLPISDFERGLFSIFDSILLIPFHLYMMLFGDNHMAALFTIIIGCLAYNTFHELNDKIQYLNKHIQYLRNEIRYQKNDLEFIYHEQQTHIKSQKNKVRTLERKIKCYD
jgi:hypothetical protein